MKKKIFAYTLFVLVYLSGSFCSYIYFRSNYKSRWGKYTTVDRVVNVGLSSFSWVGLGLNFLAWNAFVAMNEPSKEANW